MATTKPGRTKLQRDLAGAAERRRPTPLDAFRLARRKFLAAERIDMSALADELGVNRVTLYRWVGSREQLLVEGVWSLGERTLEKIDPGGPPGGEARPGRARRGGRAGRARGDALPRRRDLERRHEALAGGRG